MAGLPDSIQVFERGWLSSNNVLLTGPDDTALIDSGYLTHAPQTLALVRHALAGRPLDRLLNTHLHSDHCGGNAILQAHYGCHTAIPVAEAAKVRDWDVDALSFQATGQQCARFGFDATIAPGDVLALAGMEWRALGAPGHDPHSLIFYCPEQRVLVSADVLWENGFGVIFPELAGESGLRGARHAGADRHAGRAAGAPRPWRAVRRRGRRAGPRPRPAGLPVGRPAAQRRERGQGAAQVPAAGAAAHRAGRDRAAAAGHAGVRGHQRAFSATAAGPAGDVGDAPAGMFRCGPRRG